MKNKIFILALASLFSFCTLMAQQTPKPSPPTPAAPPSLPTPPEAPEPPETPAPRVNMPPKSDTTKISIGDKQIYIIDTKVKKDTKKEEWEEDLEESMNDLKEDLEEAKVELEDSKAEMERESKKDHDENQSPGGNSKYKFKYKKGIKTKAADIDFLDFDFGINLIRVDGSVSKELKEDLELKTWGSWSYTFNFLPTKIYLGSRNVMLMTGFGWRIGQFEFKEKVQFEANKNLIYSKNDAYKKSQFVIHQLQIPLGIYVESKKIKGLGRIGFGVGSYAGILIHQEHETKTENPNQNIETEEDFGFEEFRYGLSTRLDIGAIKLFSNVDMNKLWKDNDFKNIECGIWLDF